MSTAPAPVAPFPKYAAWALRQPRLRHALDRLVHTDAVPVDAAAHLDVIAELAAAREAACRTGGNVEV